MKVYVFDSSYNGYSVMLAFKELDFTVYALDSRRTIGTYSLYNEFIKVIDPLYDETGFIKNLIEIGKQNSEKCLLFPTNDQWIDAISKNYSKLDKYFLFISPSRHAVNILLDKLHFANWINDRWNAPRSYISVDQINECSLPLVAKPTKRRVSNNIAESCYNIENENFRYIVCNTIPEVKSTLKRANDIGVDIYFQQLLNGDSRSLRTVGIVSVNGKLLSYVYGRKVRGYPFDHGDTVVGELNNIPPYLLNQTKEILFELKYTGIAEIEYFYQINDNKYYLLEINPRSWSWVGVALPSGVNMVKILIDSIIKNKKINEIKTVNEKKLPFRYIKFFDDTINILFKYKKNNIKISEIIRNIIFIFKNKAVIAGFEKFDPVVNIIVIFQSIRKLFKN